MLKKQDKNLTRKRRHRRVRKTITGTPERPRLCVFRSSKHIEAQIIDDFRGETLAAASTKEPELKGNLEKTYNVAAAEAVGEVVAKRAREKGIKQVVFDRGGYIYHGRVAALAKGARSAGLDF